MICIDGGDPERVEKEKMWLHAVVHFFCMQWCIVTIRAPARENACRVKFTWNFPQSKPPETIVAIVANIGDITNCVVIHFFAVCHNLYLLSPATYLT